MGSAMLNRPTITTELQTSFFEALGARPGEVSVRRRRTANGDEFLVIAYPGSHLKESDIPNEYSGYLVRYEKHKFPKAG